MEFKHVKPLDDPIDEGTGGVGDRRIREAVDDDTGKLGGLDRGRNELSTDSDKQ